jgi:hypothetical protein
MILCLIPSVLRKPIWWLSNLRFDASKLLLRWCTAYIPSCKTFQLELSI